MKREHLIIIAIAIFVLAGCAGSVLVGVLLWPDSNPGRLDGPVGGDGGNSDSSVYAAVIGTWECTQASPNIRAGSTLTFVDDANRHAYWAPDTTSKPAIEFRYTLYVQDSFNCALEQTNAPSGQQPIKLKVLVDVLDGNKMELYAFTEHRASDQPAILKRVQK